MIKVLMGCPTHEVKQYCTEKWINHAKAIKAASVSNSIEVDLVLVDNSPPNSEYTEWLQSQPDITVKHLTFPPNLPLPVHERIAGSSNYLREEVLLKEYDFLFMVEVDVLPSPRSLARMVNYLYMNNLQAVQAEYYNTYTRAAYEYHKFWLNGICLIHREVLEQIPYRYELEQPNGLPDAFFAIDMDKLGIKRDFIPNLIAIHDELNPNGVGFERRGWNLLREEDYADRGL